MAINDAGAVVGSADLSSGYAHAVLWDSGGVHDLGTLGGSQSYAYGVNDGGIAVGYSWLAGDDGTHACVLLDGGMVDLNADIAPGSGWELTAAYAINANGQIAGSGVLNGTEHAFRLDPLGLPPSELAVVAPEPGDWALFLSGALLILWLRFGAVCVRRFNG